MAVPDTNTFTMQDVRDNVTGTPNDLVAAFSMANDYAFDPNYRGIKDGLMNFRNYDENRNYLEVSINLIVAPKLGSSGSFNIISNTSWIITASAPWAGTAPAMGSGNSTINYNIDGNGSPTDRLGTFTIQTTSGSPFVSRIININQAG